MAQFGQNDCYFQGRLVKDPELRSTSSGVPVINFSLAINRRWKSREDEWKEETSYLDFEAWDSAAENIAQNFKKGSPMWVKSEAKMDSWQDNEGKARNRIKFRVNQFASITPPAKRGGGNQVPKAEPVEEEVTSDIPF